MGRQRKIFGRLPMYKGDNNESCDGVDYSVLYSGAVYNTGAKVNIITS